MDDLKGVLGYWAWLEEYGGELLGLYQGLEIGPKQPKPRAVRGEKRGQAEEQENPSHRRTKQTTF